MSTLRARCPDCRTHTAVAVDAGYECHACGATFAAGLVRVPRAWGESGDPMAEAALGLAVRYPETGVVAAASLEEQSAELAAQLPVRPLVLGGCCCAHIGAIRGLAGRGGSLAVVWFDAHGDLNTPDTSPSGNLWGMPLRMAIDEGSVDPGRVALVGARNLDPPEVAYLEATGIDADLERATKNADRVYLAVDVDVFDPTEIDCFMPEPDGLTISGVESAIRQIAGLSAIAGLGFTGTAPTTATASLERLATAAGL